MNQNPYVFIVGCPRSGTTLLQRMLDHHPSVAVANEARFMLGIVKDVAVGTDPPLTPRLVEWVCNYKRFPRLGLSDAAVKKATAKSSTYGEFISALFSEYGNLQGKPLAGEKTPKYGCYLPHLHSIFPWVRTIHLIRDGRSVALSVLQWARDGKGPARLQLWSEEPVAVCALWWHWRVSIGRRDGATLGLGRYHDVKYEELVNEPEKTLRDVTAFLELPFAPEMLSYHQGQPSYGAGISTRQVWLPPTPGLRDWRIQMPERDVELFEAIAGDLLSELGYERAFRTCSSGILAVAERCSVWWQLMMAGRAGVCGHSSRTLNHHAPRGGLVTQLENFERSTKDETVEIRAQ